VTNKPLLFLASFRLKKETGPLGSIETAAIVEAIVEAILAQIKPELTARANLLMGSPEMQVALSKIRPHTSSNLAHQKKPAQLLVALESTIQSAPRILEFL